MRIQHNIMAMNAYRNYNTNTNALSKNLEKLSSGYKINRAGDDAAGLAISEKMRAQITGLEAAQKNAKDGISLVQTAEGALTEVHDMLNRMVSLAQQSANGTYDDAVDRNNLQMEFDDLTTEINRIADSVNFNGINLLDGGLSSEGMKQEWGATLSVAATATKAGVDAKFSAKASGVTKIVFAHSSTSQGAKLATDGTVTITVDARKNHSAADLTKLLKNATTTATGTTTKELLENVVKKASFTGSGVVTGSGTVTGFANGLNNVTTAQFKGEALTLQIGDTSDDFNHLDVEIADMHIDNLGLADVKIADQSSAQAAVSAIKDAINQVSTTRGKLGATQNRLDHTINNLSVMQENIQDAEATIRDTDVANEMMAYTKNNILIQSAQAMLAQANQIPQGVLQLLQ